MKSVMTSNWTRRARRIALGGALGLAVLAAIPPVTAQAQDDDDSNSKTTIWNFDKKILNGMMRGLGLRNGNESSIDREPRTTGLRLVVGVALFFLGEAQHAVDEHGDSGVVSDVHAERDHFFQWPARWARRASRPVSSLARMACRC